MSFMLKKALLYALLITTALTVLNSCQSQTPTSETPTPPTNSGTTANSVSTTNPQSLRSIKYTLSWLMQGVDAPLVTAIRKGYFQEEGLDVVLERGYGSSDSITKIAAGLYEIGEGDLYSMIEFNQKNPQQKLIAVAIVFDKSPFTIITLKNKGIQSLKDLAGKKLGAPAGDAPRRLWPVLAEEAGVDPNSVTWTTMEPQLRETFLVQNQVDGISGFVTSAYPNIIKAGVKPEDVEVFYYSKNGLDFYGSAVITTEKFAKENPEVVKAFLNAYIKGMQDAIANPDAALQDILALGKEQGQILDPTTEALRLKIAQENLILTPEVKANGLATVDPQRLQKTIEQTVEGFELTKTPKVEEVFNNSFLPPKEERMIKN